MQRTCLKNASVQEATVVYFNELAIIFGNDIAEGNAVERAIETEEEGQLFEEAIDLDDDADFNTLMDEGFNTNEFEEENLQSNNSTTSARPNPSTPTRRRQKRKKPSMANCLDVICESIQNIDRGMTKGHSINVDKREEKHDMSSAYAALKAMPKITQETMIVAYDFFTSKATKAQAFIGMTEQEREVYIRYKFGGDF